MSNDWESGLVCLFQFHISFLLGVIGGSALYDGTSTASEYGRGGLSTSLSQKQRFIS